MDTQVDRLWIVAVLAIEIAALEEDHRAVARSVNETGIDDVIDRCFQRIHSIRRSADKVHHRDSVLRSRACWFLAA